MEQGQMARQAGDWITAYLKYTDNSEPPELYKLWVAISVIAASLQRKVFLRWEKKVYPNMYIILVGPSGKCRKGTAMYPGEDLLRKLGIPLAAEAITREALIKELERTQDSAKLALSQITLHSSLTVFSKELTVFLGYNNMSLMSDLTDWYDCSNVWTYRTKNAGVNELINVFVNIIGATTPELIQSTLPRDAIGGGLASRIIFVYENKKGKIVPAPFLSKADDELYEDLFTDLAEISMITGEYEIDGEFLDHYTEWYIAQEDNPPFQDDRFSGYFQRRAHHALKLSMILTASAGNEKMMTADTLKRAINILEQTEVKMPMVFRGMGASEYAAITDKVMHTIARAGEDGITVPRLLNLHYYDADKYTLDRIIGTLDTMNFCERNMEGTTTTLVYIPKKKRKKEDDDSNKQV